MTSVRSQWGTRGLALGKSKVGGSATDDHVGYVTVVQRSLCYFKNCVGKKINSQFAFRFSVRKRLRNDKSSSVKHPLQRSCEDWKGSPYWSHHIFITVENTNAKASAITDIINNYLMKNVHKNPLLQTLHFIVAFQIRKLH